MSVSTRTLCQTMTVYLSRVNSLVQSRSLRQKRCTSNDSTDITEDAVVRRKLSISSTIDAKTSIVDADELEDVHRLYKLCKKLYASGVNK